MLGFISGVVTPQIVAAYVILALIVSLFGRNRTMGYWGTLVLSLLLTPIATGFFMIVFNAKKIRSA